MSNELSNMVNKSNFVFTSGDANPLGVGNQDRRFVVVESKPKNLREAMPEQVRRPEVKKIVEQLRSIHPSWDENRLIAEAKGRYTNAALKSMVTR